MTLATDANEEAMGKAALLVQNDVKASFPSQGTGRTYQRGSRIHRASAPGEVPAVDTSILRKSITHEITRTAKEIIGKVGSNLVYAKSLEIGTHKMAPRPYLRPALLRNKVKIVKIFKNHNK